MLKFTLVNHAVRDNCQDAVSEAPDGWHVEIKPPRRSLDQNAKIHAELMDLIQGGVKFAGKTRNMDEWKAIFVSAFMQAKGQAGEVVPGIEGEFVSLRWSTAKMPKAVASELIEYIQAWKASNV